MARVTVEDCIDKVTNRFELILLASHRSRQISAGGRISVERDNDKNPVVALREIAEEQLSPEDLKEDLINSLQKHVEVDEPEDQMDAQDEDIISGAIEQLPDDANEGKDDKKNAKKSAGKSVGDSAGGTEETKSEKSVESKAAFDTLSQEEMLARLQELKPPEKADNF